MRTPRTFLPWLALASIAAGAATLRLVDLGAVRLDPFYDAAVRSMSLSWHNFFFGAYEPGGSVSIDKPPVDLWLQVSSVKLLGWGSTALKLPEALAGAAAVPLLYAALVRPFGVLAGLLAAAALAVLPIEVITARSDTMDAVMMLLLVLALFAAVRAVERDSTAWLLAAAAALGIAFNVKLLESIVAVPGLFVLVCLGMGRPASDPTLSEGPSPPPRPKTPNEPLSPPSPASDSTQREEPLSPPAPESVPTQAARRGSRARLAGQLAAAGAVYAVIALSWLGTTLLFPAHERPYAIGSTNGSAWNAAFVFNGSERLSGKSVEVGQPSTPAPRQTRGGRVIPASTPITPPSPTRLLARSGQLPAKWLGWEALLALLVGVFAVVVVLRRSPGRVQRATTIGVFVWLATGLVLFSAMARLHPRYVESFTPAVAAMFGIGAAFLAGLPGRARLLVVPVTALLAIPLVASVEAVADHTSDAGNVGALDPAEQRALSAYLLAHQAGAHYELAAGASTSVASLIVQDQRPVLMLTTYNGLPFTSVGRLRSLIAQGAVRYAFLNSVCPRGAPKTNAGCAPAALWIRAHGVDVSRQAGLRPGVLWRLPAVVP